MKCEMFGRLNREGNVAVHYNCGYPVVQLSVDLRPVGTELSCRYAHQGGIVLTMDDFKTLGIPMEGEDIRYD